MAPILDPPGVPDDDPARDPLQREILRDQLDRVAEEKRRALTEPGPSWREWFYFDASKWWIGLGFLIVDAWIIVGLLDAGLLPWIAPAVIGAIYLEFLCAQYLWYSPGSISTRRHREFHRSLIRPVPYGRWTPEALYIRQNPAAAAADQGPQLEEFR